MSVGERLKEERQRLGLSQPAFAGLAGASRGAQLKWEKDEASPNALALIAFAEAGADVTYILTGRTADDRRADAIQGIADEIAEIRRAVLDPEQEPSSAVLEMQGKRLRSIASADAKLLTPALADEVASLLNIVTDEQQLRQARIEQFAAQRSQRELARRRLADWFDGQEYRPNEGVMHMLLTLNLEYGAPPKQLGYLVEEVHADIVGRQ